MIQRALLVLAALFVPLAAWAQFRLASPEAGETVHSNQGQVPVVVLGAPPDARFQVLLDGAPYGPVRAMPRFVVEGVERGAHRLEVAWIDHAGREVARTETVEFYMWQASRLFPNRQGE